MGGSVDIRRAVAGVALCAALAVSAMPALADDGVAFPDIGAPVDLEGNPDHFRAVGIDENGEVISNIVGGVHSPSVDIANGAASGAIGGMGGNAAGIGSFAGEPGLNIGPTIDTIVPGFVGQNTSF